MFRLVVFDLDGTLVDSRRDLAESANAVLGECGCALHSEETVGRMVGDGAAMLVARAFAAAQCDQPPDALQRFLSIYESRLLRFTRPYEGVPEMLAEAQARARLAVLTNKPLDATRMILEGLELAGFFGALVVGGDGPFQRKPDPAGLRYLMHEAGVSAGDTLLVGDSVVDWRTANAAAIDCCLARYGFGFHDFPVAELACATRVIDSPEALVRML